jgi:hypothetical protein
MAVMLVSLSLHAQERCGVEAKLLLSPSELQAVVNSLNAGKETTSQIYFFDTGTLDLLSQGLIIRLRQGATNDLTVKVRQPRGKEVLDPSGKEGHLKCEDDFVGSGSTRSYSIAVKFVARQLPYTGTDLFELLTAGQRELLKQAHVSIDWVGVTRIAVIHSIDWHAAPGPPLNKVTLEMWKWKSGQVLELSTRAGPGSGPSRYAELRQLAIAKGFSLSTSQETKTAVVLKNIAHPGAR